MELLPHKIAPSPSTRFLCCRLADHGRLHHILLQPSSRLAVVFWIIHQHLLQFSSKLAIWYGSSTRTCHRMLENPSSNASLWLDDVQI